jgi:protein-S-isoprenylcysteine O-methyltransferase Ste14
MSHETTRGHSTLTVHKYRSLKPMFKWRGYFYVPALLVMTMCFWNEYENDLIIWSTGPFLMALGLVIRIWATKHIGKRIPRKYRNGRVLHLVKTGPYGFVRNPLYMGNIAAMMGLCVLSELLWFIPIVFVYFLLLYSLVVRFEEYKLSLFNGCNALISLSY